ncbi:ApaG protein [Tepidamorphus gemmatus]|jgi:ApaG protein|uniref:Protein ApaG n=1 Tax=Tepidamorphus gemmatus TaxID=747076 RepID=A0A4V2UZY7_9HYPH|nr:Co2+/Mg2+ efflux protein ApaG [Tepidamorphus gemmatus]TCT13209.1 ApaG protein [Tepidamorphus gemmatus]
MYRAETRGVVVTVEPAFSEDRSSPDAGAYFWTYTIEIANTGAETVQLINRRWLIVDASGKTFEVRGPGVVGEQPVLGPGEAFRYTSGVPLATPSGMMSGSYEMATASGERFHAAIPAFSLDSPYVKPTIN